MWAVLDALHRCASSNQMGGVALVEEAEHLGGDRVLGCSKRSGRGRADLGYVGAVLVAFASFSQMVGLLLLGA